MKTITFYNNKGGVSKTTTAFNYAVYLTTIGRKVLIIDADPQCNMTQLFLASSESYEDSLDDELPGSSILDAFRERFAGESSRVNVNKLELLVSEYYKDLNLLRGDINFSAIAEPLFGTSVQLAITNNVNEKNTYVSFNRMVNDFLGLGFDNIIIDVGPSSGAISRLAVLSSDAFVIPVTPDRFSYQAISTLSTIVHGWEIQDEIIRKTLEGFGITDITNPTIFAGAIIQNFQLHKSKVKTSYQNWKDKIEEKLKINFMENKDIQHIKILDDLKTPYIAEIEDLGPLAPISQLVGKAIFHITKDDTALASSDGRKYYGSVYQVWEDKMVRYKSSIEKIFHILDSE